MLAQVIIGDGGYIDANGVYHTGAKIDTNNVQVGGSARSSLEESYNAEEVKIDFTAKLTENGTILNLISPNTSLAFTVDFVGCSEFFTPYFPASLIGISGDISDIDDVLRKDANDPNNKEICMKFYHKIVTVSGIFASCTINGILHNILLPTMKLHVFLGWVVKTKNGTQKVRDNYQLVITPTNDYFCLKPKNPSVADVDEPGAPGPTNNNARFWNVSKEKYRFKFRSN